MKEGTGDCDDCGTGTTVALETVALEGRGKRRHPDAALEEFFGMWGCMVDPLGLPSDIGRVCQQHVNRLFLKEIQEFIRYF